MAKNSRSYMPTYMLITANVAVYVSTCILSGGFTTSPDVINSLGQVNMYVWNGQVWRLFTAMFVHEDPLHIFGNMFFLLIFGLRAEDMFDIKEYLLIYLLSGLSGGLLTLFLWPPLTASVGASGAIFGVLGATIIYERRSIGQSIFGGLIYAFFFFIINLGSNVNYLAHLGGLGTGLLIGYLLAVSRSGESRIKRGYRYPDSWGKAGYSLKLIVLAFEDGFYAANRILGEHQYFNLNFLAVS